MLGARAQLSLATTRPGQATAATIEVDRRLTPVLKPHLACPCHTYDETTGPINHHCDDTSIKIRYSCALELKIHLVSNFQKPPMPRTQV